MLEEFFRIKVGTIHTALDDDNQSQGLNNLLSGTFYTFDAMVTQPEIAKKIGYDIRGYLKFNKKEDGRYEYIAFVYAPKDAKVIKGWAHKDTRIDSIERIVYGILMSYISGFTNMKDILATRRQQRTQEPITDNLLRIPMAHELFDSDRAA